MEDTKNEEKSSKPSSRSINGICDYDQGLNESIQQAMYEYFEGEVDYNTAIDNFYTAAMEKYPELTR